MFWCGGGKVAVGPCGWVAMEWDPALPRGVLEEMGRRRSGKGEGGQEV